MELSQYHFVVLAAEFQLHVTVLDLNLTKKKQTLIEIKVNTFPQLIKNKYLSHLTFADTTSVDAVSRIGATSIGEVSLSVASGSHIGVTSQNPPFGVAASIRESTTALAGSITG